MGSLQLAEAGGDSYLVVGEGVYLRHDGGIVWRSSGLRGRRYMGAGVEGIASDGAWRLMFKLGPQMLPAVTQVRPRAMHGTTSQIDAGTVSRVSLQLYVSAISSLYRRDIFSLLHPRCPRRPNYIISRLIPATCTASASLPQPSRALHRLSVTFRDSHACAVQDRRIHVPDFTHTPHTQHAPDV